MKDIELVIKIPEGLKKDFETEQWTALSCMEMKNALMNGTPLQKGHGKIIDESRITEVYIQTTEKEYIHGVLIPPRIKIIGTNAPTIIQSDSEVRRKNEVQKETYSY